MREDVRLTGKVAADGCVDDQRLRGEERAEVAGRLRVEGRWKAPSGGIRRVRREISRDRCAREEPHGNAGGVPQQGIDAATVLSK